MILSYVKPDPHRSESQVDNSLPPNTADQPNSSPGRPSLAPATIPSGVGNQELASRNAVQQRTHCSYTVSKSCSLPCEGGKHRQKGH